ncbi:phosphatase PAP2 family protein [Neolewinella agarilytica]|uniref:phosphatase PAP2 family protein n=1 Tax=Neolewinella agarilytica TaxID=478744 RepID=UPI0023534DB2|nr:phosphatase PAP2 family protein [Neolewinella agarilytica]
MPLILLQNFFTLLLCLLLNAGLFAQYTPTVSPYHLSLKRELVFGGLGAISLGTGTWLQNRAGEPTATDLRLQKYDQINSFDRLGSHIGRDRPRKLSDLGLNVGSGLPALVLLSRKSRSDFPKIALLYAETMALTGGITSITKAGFLRVRPYVYAPDWDPNQPLESGDRASFLSGHTSLSAAGSFFFARVFADYHPDSRLKPYVWGLAATIPAVTGYLRIRAARHFPSDVLVGYALGASIGYLVPTLHKKPILPRGMTISPMGQGMYLSYRF